jgi:5'-AMP-activated protein kinase catalytic alpha subunit
MAQPLDTSAAGFSQAPNVQSFTQSAEFFLSNYRLGKTLGIGSFGKASAARHEPGRRRDAQRIAAEQ